MWNVPIKLMCRQHLLGEHLEMHMLLNTIKHTTRSLRGFIMNGFVKVHHIIHRHNELVNEMTRRGYNHKSPMNSNDQVKLYKAGNVDIKNNILILRERCEECKKLQEAYNESR